jgi:uncharacterized protein DUF4303/putative pyrroloquinoline-quinone binding quinoprotein/WD40 domain-containing protein
MSIMAADTVLTEAIADAARRAFTQVRAEHPAENFYCFALFASGVVGVIEPTCMGEQALREAAQDAVDSAGSGGSLATRLTQLRWSPVDTPYYLHGEEHFAEVQRLLDARPDPYELDDDAAEAEVHARLEACFDALARLDREGLFGRGTDRDRVLVTVLQGDQSQGSLLRDARRLNPATVLQRLADDLQIPEPIGSFTTLGSHAVYEIVALAYAPAGRVLAAGGSEGEVFAWDLSDGRSGGRELLAARQDDACWAAALSADGRLLVTGDGAEVAGIDLVSGERTRLAHLTDQVSGLGISPDGTIVVAAGWSGTVTAFETRTGQERWRVASLAKCVRFSPDGQLLALAGAGVLLVDPASGSLRRRLLGRVSISTYQHLAWSPDGSTVAIGNQGPRGQRLTLWRWQDPTSKPRPLRLPSTEIQLRDDVCDLAFSPSGTVLASAHAEGDIHLWNTESGEHRLRLRGRQDSIAAVVFLDEGRLAAAGLDYDRGPPVDIWDL